MKIIGRIHDYYDGAIAYGADNSLVFLRETTQQDDTVLDIITKILTDKGIDATSYYGKRALNLPCFGDSISTQLNIEIIGFCGKLYAGIRLIGRIENKDALPIVVNEVFYPTNGYHKLQETLSQIDEKYSVKYFKTATSMFGPQKYSNFERQCKVIDALWGNELTDVFVKMNAPYFCVKYSQSNLMRYAGTQTVESIPVLKNSNFYKVKDSYQAFQEISMYLGGVLPRQAPELVDISDKDRIEQHGFNKLSFRNPIKISQLKK